MNFEDQVNDISDEVELQGMMDALAETAMDSTSPINFRDLATKRRVIVQQRLNQLSNPAYTESPTEVLERMRETNPAAAEALEHQMKVDAVTAKASEVASAAVDEGIANWRKPSQEDVSAAAQAAEEARNTLPPHFQTLKDRREAQDKAAGLRAAANTMQDSGEASIQAKAEALNAEADQVEAAIQR